MTKCAACLKPARKLRRAMVLRGPKVAKPGKVCRDCAANGWLFVLGDDRSPTAAAAPSPASAPARARLPKKPRGAVLEKYGLGIRPKKLADGMPGITVGAGRVLSALVTAGGPVSALSRDAISVFTGYKKSSRDTYISQLISARLVELEGQTVIATSAGRVESEGLESVPTGSALVAWWLERLKGGERAILAHLTKAGTPVLMKREGLSELTGYKKSSRDTYISKLVTRRLVRAERSGIVAVRELFR